MVCHSAAERSHSTSEVRGRSREDPMPEGQQPRGVTPSPRSGATAESTRLPRCRNARGATPRQRSGRGGPWVGMIPLEDEMATHSSILA